MKFLRICSYTLVFFSITLFAEPVSSFDTTIPFTKSEKEWLNAHPIIRVGMDPDYAPFEWMNEKGEHVGMAVDYLRLLEQKIGIHFEIIKNTSWSEAIEMAKRGEVDMLTSIIETPKRLTFLSFTKPYRSIQTIIVDNGKGGFIGSLKHLEAKRVVVEKGYFIQELLALHYPNIHLVTVASTKEALEKVMSGDADAYVGDMHTINYTMMKHHFLNLRFSGAAELSNDHRFGVSHAQRELVSILNKAMDAISPQELDTIFNRWSSIRIEQGIPLKALITYGAIVALFLACMVYWMYRLKREIAYRKGIEVRESMHKTILEMIARMQPLQETLEAIVANVEHCQQGAIGSIVLIDPKTSMIREIIAPHLPTFYNEGLVGLKMEKGVGSCGTAIATRQRVIVEDIEIHPYWKDYKAFAKSAGLGACWSEPILSSLNEVLGTFAIYHKHPHSPSASDVMAIEQSAYLASIAIEKENIESKLRESEAHYRTLTEEVSDIVWKTDKHFVVTYISPSDEQVRGFTSEEVVGRHIFEFFTPQSIASITKKMQQRQEAEKNGIRTGTIDFEAELTCKDGRLIWGEVLSKPERNELGEIVGYHGITREITKRKQLQEEVEQLAFYDVLTQLPNRQLATERLAQSLNSAKRNQKHYALMFLDLDNLA